MVGQHCVVIGCSNGDYRLSRWKKTVCQVHNCFNQACSCQPPFRLFSFPDEKLDPETRKKWIKLINRKSLSGRGIWAPTKSSRVCSIHFVNGIPSQENPYPMLRMGYHLTPQKARPPPLARYLPSPRKLNVRRKIKLSSNDTISVPFAITEQEVVEEDESDMQVIVEEVKTWEHNYCKDVSQEVKDKEKEISHLKSKMKQLEQRVEKMKYENLKLKSSSANSYRRFIETNKLVRSNTGLQGISSLNALHGYLMPKAMNMRYWLGKKRSQFGIKKKRGTISRSLTMKAELVLVLMKIRLGITNILLCSLFGISAGACSSIINTWIKLLAHELKPLILWPDRESVSANIPSSVKDKYPNLRCTLDCAETFIQRPRDLLLQAATWSDYKHHNTVKYLVAIAPNGLISFVSEAWGGRTTDRYIVQQSGLLDKIDPGDIILADRGFTIQEDLLFRQASLVIPPPGSGKLQMSAANVRKTRHIANVRIHVERAINRLKWFKVLSTTIPISLVPLVDDILVICAALCNLLPPLVK